MAAAAAADATVFVTVDQYRKLWVLARRLLRSVCIRFGSASLPTTMPEGIYRNECEIQGDYADTAIRVEVSSL